MGGSCGADRGNLDRRVLPVSSASRSTKACAASNTNAVAAHPAQARTILSRGRYPILGWGHPPVYRFPLRGDPPLLGPERESLCNSTEGTVKGAFIPRPRNAGSSCTSVSACDRRKKRLTTSWCSGRHVRPSSRMRMEMARQTPTGPIRSATRRHEGGGRKFRSRLLLEAKTRIGHFAAVPSRQPVPVVPIRLRATQGFARAWAPPVPRSPSTGRATRVGFGRWGG